MKKLGILLLALMMVVGSVGCGTETKKKDTTKKEVVKNEVVEDTVDEEAKKEESVEEDKVADETSSEEAAENNQDSTTKTETNNNKNNTTNSATNKTSTTKPSQQVTQPTPSHVHNWIEVKEQVAVPEKGHYEPTYAWLYYCDYCKADLTDTEEQERRDHEKGCVKGGVIQSYREVGQHWVVDTPSTTEARVVGYKCSCGATREKTQYAGMYSVKDQASWDRLNACKSFFKEGLAGEGSDLTVWASYGYGRSVTVCNDSTNGAWMWISLTDWKLDDYSYLQDSVKEGIIDQEEAKLVEAIYEEIPSIFKGAIERVAPQGGTELYNYVEKLVIQANGNPVKVDELEGAQGSIPENIPGLYVTIEELRGGFALMFWAE